MGTADHGRQIAAAIDVAEQRAREAVPGLRLVIYLEPDIERTCAPRRSNQLRGVLDPASWQQDEG